MQLNVKLPEGFALYAKPNGEVKLHNHKWQHVFIPADDPARHQLQIDAGVLMIQKREEIEDGTADKRLAEMQAWIAANGG